MIEQQHEMYLNAIQLYDGKTEGQIEQQHEMYLNAKKRIRCDQI